MSRNSTLWVAGSLLMFLLMLGLGVFGEVGPVQAGADFNEELQRLVALQILPEGLDPKGGVTYRQFVQLGESLMRGWKQDDLTYELGITVPEGLKMTYREGMKIAGMYLGYMEDEGVPLMQRLTPELKKTDREQLTQQEMAYIFYTMLHSKHRIGNHTVLEERYLAGINNLAASRIMRITSGEMELEAEGSLALADQRQAFQILDGQLQEIPFHKLYVGQEGVRFFYNQAGEIQTALVLGESFPEKIRVLVSQEIDELGGSLSHEFEQLEIMGNGAFKVLARENGKLKTLLFVEKDQPVTFTNEEGKVKVSYGDMSQIVEGRIYLNSYYPHTIYFVVQSTTRRGGYPQYLGSLEVVAAPEQEGALHLINELPIEWYLRRVVPSEMPTSWEKEAFKVQAVAARSFAIFQILNGRFEAKSAHVDDSTAFQVYNNGSEHPVVNEAIAETEGIVPLYEGELIDAVFFSTSAGYTAGNEEVWHSSWTGKLPGHPAGYLRPRPQLAGGTATLDLTVEENAVAFFKDQQVQSYDAISPYFRWKVELSREMLEKTISKNLLARERADQLQGLDMIQVISGMKLDAENFSIGQLKELKVVQRGQGGNAMVLDIVGSNGTYRVIKEYNIRTVIQPTREQCESEEDVLLQFHDGSVYRNYAILPSSFVAFETERSVLGKVEQVTIYGGGNGHGVGMSQWGVRGMVQAGYGYEEILGNYYEGIELRKVY